MIAKKVMDYDKCNQLNLTDEEYDNFIRILKKNK